MNSGFQILWAVAAGFWILLDIVTLGRYAQQALPKGVKFFIFRIQFNFVEILSRPNEQLSAKLFTPIKNLHVKAGAKKEISLPLQKSEDFTSDGTSGNILRYRLKQPRNENANNNENVSLNIAVPVRMFSKTPDETHPVFTKKYLKLTLSKIGSVRINIGEIATRAWSSLNYDITSGRSENEYVPFEIHGKIAFLLRNKVHDIVFNFMLYIEAVNSDSFKNLNSQMHIEKDRDVHDEVGWNPNCLTQ